MGILQSNTQKFKQNLEDRLQTVALYPSPDTEVIKIKSRKPTKPTLQHAQSLELHAEPIQRNNESHVNAYDGRTQVLNTSKWPNSVHGVIAFKVNNVTTWGTGILIGPHVVLTAGHNLYNYETRVFTDVESLQFLPGMNGQVVPFGVIEVEQYFVSPNYVKEGKEDYGILILKKPIGEVTGYFGLACLEVEEIRTKRINVTGYPSDKVTSKPKTYEMWGMEGEASFVDPKLGIMNYLIDTESGQSGSGVWYQEGEDYYVCGVHIAGTRFVNTATLLTRDMYKQIHRWVEQVDFKDFLFKMRYSNRLEFWGQEIDAECVSLLVKYNLDDLKVLSLSWKKIGDEGATALAQNVSWTGLSELNLVGNNIGAEGARSLGQNTSWTRLQLLDLQWNDIDAEGAKALAQNLSWVNLSNLDLGRNNIGPEGAKALAQNQAWVNLSQLNLTGNNIGAEGAKAIAKNTSWTKLSELYLLNNNIGAEGAIALAQNISWPHLSKLDLETNNIGSEGAIALAQNQIWVNLSELNLWNNNIGTDGAKALAKNTSWIKLMKLDLGRNSIGVEGIEALKGNVYWNSLSKLELKENITDPKEVLALEKAEQEMEEREQGLVYTVNRKNFFIF